MKYSYVPVLRKGRAVVPLVAADVLFFSLVSPTNGNSFVAIVGCGLLALTIYVTVFLFTKIVVVFVPISESTRKRFAVFVSLLVVFLLLMQSIGQLSLRDVLAVIPLAVVLYLYLNVYSRQKPKTDIT